MMPLGYISSYKDFGQEFRTLVEQRNRQGRAFGFLFDDRRTTIWRSRLTENMRAIRALNDELGKDITLFYLNDSSPRRFADRMRYLENISEFNRTLISTLGVPESAIRFPCLTLFQVHDEVCTHLMQVPLESRSSLFLVSDMLDGIRSYKDFALSGPGDEEFTLSAEGDDKFTLCAEGDKQVAGSSPEDAGRQVAKSWSAVRVSLTLVELVNTVTDFGEKATQVINSFML